MGFIPAGKFAGLIPAARFMGFIPAGQQALQE